LSSYLDNGFQMSTKRFPKDNDVFKGFFSKNRGSVISYVEHNILLAYERFKGL
jgi:hypothetical protein